MRVTTRTAFSLLDALGETEDVEEVDIAPQPPTEEEPAQPRLPPRPARPPPQPRPQHPPDVHDRLTLEDRKYTRMCEEFRETGQCSRPVCYYAHSEEQHRAARQRLMRRVAEERAKLGWVPPPPQVHHAPAPAHHAPAPPYNGSDDLPPRSSMQQRDGAASSSGSGPGSWVSSAGYGLAPPGMPRNYKTHLCWHFLRKNGNCQFGDACMYAHGERELRQYVPDEAVVQAELAHKGLWPMHAPGNPSAPAPQHLGMQQQQPYPLHPQQQQHYYQQHPQQHPYAAHHLLPQAPPPPPSAVPAVSAADVGAVPMSGAQLAEYLDAAAQLDDDAEVPDPFICPITQVVLEDPVVAADGFTYERHAIEAWLAAKGTSPMSNEPLEDRKLLPNHTLVAAMRAVLGDHVCAGRQL